MQEKRNKRRAILLVVLIICTVMVYWLNVKSKHIDIDRQLFQLEDYSTIDKIVLESSDQEVVLAFNGSRWRINDRYDADANLITVLFQTLKQAVPKRSVASTVRDSINTLLAKTGVEVSLFSRGKPEQTFIAGGNTFKTQAYFKAPSQNDIYIMNIPGYRVYVSGIFELTENQWRDKRVFSFNWRNFQNLTAKFPERPAGDFVVAPQNNVFGIVGIKTDTTKLGAFMERVLSLTADAYLEPGKLTDSLADTQPVMVLTVTDVSKKDYSLRLFREKGVQVPGLINGEGVIFSRLKIQPILRPKSYFEDK